MDNKLIANELNKITAFCLDPDKHPESQENELKFIGMYNSLRDYSHNIGKQWWRDLETNQPINRDKGELLFLMVTELAEAYEGIRKNLADDHIKTRKAEEVELADALLRILDYCGGFNLDIGKALIHQLEYYRHIKRGFLPNTLNKGNLIMFITRKLTDAYSSECSNINSVDELAKVIILIHQYASKFDLDLGGALVEKQEYNIHRKDHSVEERKKENGKKT